MQILIIFLINLLAFSPFVKAQTVQNQTTGDLPNPYQLIKDNLKRNNYITALFELKAMENKYLASPMWKEPYLDVMIYLEGYVVNYGAAYDYEKIFYETNSSYRQVREMYAKGITASSITDYKMHDAHDAIEAVDGKRQVVMINEEQRTPFHRAVTLQLPAKLYAKGFRYFAAETVVSPFALFGNFRIWRTPR